MWDEWSSPGELIHPGDSASIASITSSDAVLDFATAVWRLRKKHLETGRAIHSICHTRRNHRCKPKRDMLECNMIKNSAQLAVCTSVNVNVDRRVLRRCD